MTRLANNARRSVAIMLAFAPIAACANPMPKAGMGDMTLQAFQQRHERKLLAADTDHDGRVSKAEFLAAAKPGKGDPAKRFARLDGNGDGFLDKAEIDAMLAKRFKRLDTNGDGVVSAQERAAARMKGKVGGVGSES